MHTKFQIDMMRGILTLLLPVTLLAILGCASIVSDSSYPVTVNPEPDDAKVEIKEEKGETISKNEGTHRVTLDASNGYFSPEEYVVEAEKTGYTSSKTTISAKLDPWYFGNFIFGGVIGLLIVDPATGSMYKLPEKHTISLEEKEIEE